MRSSFILFGFSALLFFSCKKHPAFKEEIRLTDSLKKELLENAARFNLMDSTQISYAASRINAIFAFVNANLHDTISRNEASLLSELKNASKAFKKYDRTRKDMLRYYTYNLKQLEDLSFDLNNQHIESKDSAAVYVLQEKRANTDLITMMRLHAQIIPNKLRKCDSLFPLADQWLRKLNNGILPPTVEKPTLTQSAAVEEDD